MRHPCAFECVWGRGGGGKDGQSIHQIKFILQTFFLQDIGLQAWTYISFQKFIGGYRSHSSEYHKTKRLPSLHVILLCCCSILIRISPSLWLNDGLWCYSQARHSNVFIEDNYERKKNLSRNQLGTFSVNGEWLCGGLFAVSGEIRTHRSRTRGAESARQLRVILDSVGYH